MKLFSCFITEAKAPTLQGEIASQDFIDATTGALIKKDVDADKGKTKWNVGGMQITIGSIIETSDARWIVFDYNPYSKIASAILPNYKSVAEIKNITEK